MTKIEMIQGSLRCFAFGVVGLLPVIGIPWAVISLKHYWRVKRGQGEMWNPAHRYLFWGALCARMGLALFVVVPVAVAAISLVFSNP